MKRAGFTMIELIFVIVILGILAAVAIPKLAATRNDAKVSAETTNIAQVIQNLGAEYTAQADFTNYTIAEAQAAVSCVTIAQNGASTDGNVTVSPTVSNATKCPGAIDDIVWDKLVSNSLLGGTVGSPAAKTYEFGGTGVTY